MISSLLAVIAVLLLWPGASALAAALDRTTLTLHEEGT